MNAGGGSSTLGAAEITGGAGGSVRGGSAGGGAATWKTRRPKIKNELTKSRTPWALAALTASKITAADLLVAKRQEGVQINILYDSFGSMARRYEKASRASIYPKRQCVFPVL